MNTHGGNLRKLASLAGCSQEDLLDFSANLNPLGPPEWTRPLLASQVSALSHYPDPDCAELFSAAASRYQLPPTSFLATAGAEEFFFLLPRIAGKTRAVVPSPSYVDYARSASLADLEITRVPTSPSDAFAIRPEHIQPLLQGNEIVYLGHPNNPSGSALDFGKTSALILRNPDSLFVVDEAFADFSPSLPRFFSLSAPNLLVALSLTKIFAVPGLRLALVTGSPLWLDRIRPHLPTWNVNSLAQSFGTAALTDSEFLSASQNFVREERSFLEKNLSSLPGISPFPSHANFLLCKTTSLPASSLFSRLIEKKIAIRTCQDYSGLDDSFFRSAVRTREENERLLNALDAVLSPKKIKPKKAPRSASPIMFQGTSSNAGKSVLTAALCRILLQDGLRVAPFKSQNMSLNSFVTRDGGEMGRAQVVQAQACRMEPDVRMNPVLLKPNSSTGSQVIVMGKAVANMEVREYFRYKPEAFEQAKKAYASLAAENDVLVIEGAGSPGEINLKRHDIANMAVAKMAQSPVLLVGDIDRGGVYASFVGTMEVLAEWERDLIAGFVVNRFRGQESLLADAHAAVLRHTGVPVIGTIPYLQNLGLPEEDSVSFKASSVLSSSCDSTPAAPGLPTLDLAVIDLPHISNFTDFDPFRIEPGVRLRIVRSPKELGSPDAVFLPGSKNVAADFTHLKNTGIASALAQQRHSSVLVGICGGYQMLGTSIDDPSSIETQSVRTETLGFLPIHTTMAQEKTLLCGRYTHSLSGLPLHGYEIHHGQTRLSGETPAVVFSQNGDAIGHGSPSLWGCYLHGIFDSDAFRRHFLDDLLKRKGFPPVEKILACYNIESAFDRLAETVRAHIDMEKIYRLLRLQ